MTPVTEYSSTSLLKDLAMFLKPYRWRFFLATFARVVGDLVWLYPPFALATVVNFLTSYEPGQSLRPLWVVAGFKNPQILLLDEATSHLDIESEEKIRQSLHEFFQSITAVVIAHRLTTIREMDRIIVLEQGRIQEEGRFDELYAKKGRFYELWEKQKL